MRRAYDIVSTIVGFPEVLISCFLASIPWRSFMGVIGIPMGVIDQPYRKAVKNSGRKSLTRTEDATSGICDCYAKVGGVF
jgi:hypothetical protein